MILPDAVLSHLPAIELSADEVTHTIHGTDLNVESAVLNCEAGAAVRLRSADNKLIAVGTYDDSRKAIHPTVVIANN